MKKSKLCPHPDWLLPLMEVLERLTVQRQQELKPSTNNNQTNTRSPLSSQVPAHGFHTSVCFLAHLFRPASSNPYYNFADVFLFTGPPYRHCFLPSLFSPYVECICLLFHDPWALKPFLKTSAQTVHDSSDLYSTVPARLLMHKCQWVGFCP